MCVDSWYVRHSRVIKKAIAPLPIPPLWGVDLEAAGKLEPGPGLISQTDLSTKPTSMKADWDESYLSSPWSSTRMAEGALSVFKFRY